MNMLVSQRRGFSDFDTAVCAWLTELNDRMKLYYGGLGQNCVQILKSPAVIKQQQCKASLRIITVYQTKTQAKSANTPTRSFQEYFKIAI